jgi:hypothetical protein
MSLSDSGLWLLASELPLSFPSLQPPLYILSLSLILFLPIDIYVYEGRGGGGGEERKIIIVDRYLIQISIPVRDVWRERESN